MTETTASAEQAEHKPPRALRALKALKDRRMAAMLMLAFAAGLPYGAVLGTLNAWLTQEGINPSTIGPFSIITFGIGQRKQHRWPTHRGMAAHAPTAGDVCKRRPG